MDALFRRARRDVVSSKDRIVTDYHIKALNEAGYRHRWIEMILSDGKFCVTGSVLFYGDFYVVFFTENLRFFLKIPIFYLANCISKKDKSKLGMRLLKTQTNK